MTYSKLMKIQAYLLYLVMQGINLKVHYQIFPIFYQNSQIHRTACIFLRRLMSRETKFFKQLVVLKKIEKTPQKLTNR